LQQLEGSADLKIQDAEQQRTATILGMDQQRLAAAQQASQQARAALGESIGSALGGAAAFGVAGMGKEGFSLENVADKMFVQKPV
jgi:hypothetical protein